MGTLFESLPQQRQNRGIFWKAEFLFDRNQCFQVQYAHFYPGLDLHRVCVRAKILPRPRLSNHPQHIERPELCQKKLMGGTCQMRFTGAQLPLRLNAVDRPKILKSGQQADNVLPIACMNHIQIEGGHGRSVKHGADASYDDEVNAMAGQDFEYFQKPGIRTLHGV